MGSQGMLRGKGMGQLKAEGLREVRKGSHLRDPRYLGCLSAESRQPAAPTPLGKDCRQMVGGGEESRQGSGQELGMSPGCPQKFLEDRQLLRGSLHSPSPKSSPPACSPGSSSSASTGSHCGRRVRN